MFDCFLRKFKHWLPVCFLRIKTHIRSSLLLHQSENPTSPLDASSYSSRKPKPHQWSRRHQNHAPPNPIPIPSPIRTSRRSSSSKSWVEVYLCLTSSTWRKERRASDLAFRWWKKAWWHVAPIGTRHEEAARELLLLAEHRRLLLRPRSPIETPPDPHGPQLVRILSVLRQRVSMCCRQAQPWRHRYRFQLGRWAPSTMRRSLRLLGFATSMILFWVLLRFNEFLNLFLFLLEFILR